MKKWMILLLAIIPGLTLAQFKIEGARIKTLSLNNNFAPGVVFIDLEGGDVKVAKNSCATTSWEFTHKVTSDEISKAQFSMLLAAYASQAKVTMQGSGDCRVGYGVETLFRIDLTK